MKKVHVSLPFDQPVSRDFRFLEEAAQEGELHAVLWSDAVCRALTGRDPKFPEAERRYLLQSVRQVVSVARSGPSSASGAPPLPPAAPGDVWAVPAADDCAETRAAAAGRGLTYRMIADAELTGFPAPAPSPASGRPKALVTGCYDLFHSGHVRFFEEVAAMGELYVVVGNDENLRHLKGEGHPLFPAEERRYVVGSIRQVHQALIATGMGWLDAEPEMVHIRPDFYVVNEDGDKPEKRAYCERHGIRYLVRRRLPKPGLPRRTSTDLRGF